MKGGWGGAGDSACVIPTQTIPESCLKTIREWTPAIARALKVVGLLNIQYCIQDDQVCLPPRCLLALLPHRCVFSACLYSDGRASPFAGG